MGMVDKPRVLVDPYPRRMEEIFSPADLAFMQRLKSAFNPTGLCNPGKVFPTRKSCVEVGPVAYKPHAIEEQGLAQRF